MKFDKLVRDKIPEIMGKDGKRAITHTATPEEYDKRLREKLKEEATEFYVSGRAEELADVLEVLHAISDSKGIPFAEIEQTRKKKAEERGTFRKRIVLDGAE